MVGEDEQGTTTGASENYVDGPFGYVDPSDLAAGTVIDEDLSVGYVHVAFRVDSYTFTTTRRKGLQIAERSVSVQQRFVSDVFRLAAHINVIAGMGADETVRV